MMRRQSKAGIVLLALLRALIMLVSLGILLSLIPLMAPRAEPPTGEPGPSGEAVVGGNGDPGADSPGPYMTVDLFWEVPAQGLNASEASPAGLKNETGLGNSSWPLMERSELITLLKETLPVLEPEPVNKEAPQEGQQAVPDEENSEVVEATEIREYPPGVDKRFSRAEDTKTDPNTVENMANPGTVYAELTWSIFGRCCCVAVVCGLIALLLLKVAPAWAKDIKERLAALRASSELLDSETRDKEFMVEI